MRKLILGGLTILLLAGCGAPRQSIKTTAEGIDKPIQRRTTPVKIPNQIVNQYNKPMSDLVEETKEDYQKIEEQKYMGGL